MFPASFTRRTLNPSQVYFFVLQFTVSTREFLSTLCVCLQHRIWCARNSVRGGRLWRRSSRERQRRLCVDHHRCWAAWHLSGHATILIREKELNEKPNRVPIGLTGHATEEQCMQAGMDNYLQKPARLADLKRIIGKWTP